MKKVLVNCCALLVLLISCQKENIEIENSFKENKLPENILKNNNNSADDGNELVILYPDGTTEAEKILKRAEYEIEAYKKCECADPNLELWIFGRSQSNDGGLEEKSATAKADEEIEGAEFNPNIKISEEIFVEYGGSGNTTDGMMRRVTNNQGVTVAVLDTGIMYDYQGFTSPFLYNSDTSSCTDNGYQEYFGWNFVNENNNPYDNHSGRHGTIVTTLIASKLEAVNADYQILPVKVADETGNIRYFDALCGFQFAAKKPDVDVINMSFGWYHYNRELMQKFIEDVEETILVVTSSGNHGINNDEFPHYPSSYDTDNILAVAALAGHEQSGGHGDTPGGTVFLNPNGSSGSNTGLADFSNRGTYSVDIAAPGHNIPFIYNNEVIYISGTSFAAAYVSGYAAYLKSYYTSAIELKNGIIQNSIYDPELYEIKYSKHIPE